MKARGRNSGKVVIVEPPLPLSVDFIDYPWLNLLASVQVAGVMQRQARLEVEIIDGLSPGGLKRKREGLWLGQGREGFLSRLDGLDGHLVVWHVSAFAKTSAGRRWLRRCLSRVPGDIPQVLADMSCGGMHHLELPRRAWRDFGPAVRFVLEGQAEGALGEICKGLQEGVPLPFGRLTGPDFDLRDLPRPAWELVDVDGYFDFCRRVVGSALHRAAYRVEPSRTLPLLTSRGCPYACAFCTSRVGLKRTAGRPSFVPLSRVASWLEHWCRKYGLQRLIVLDDIANLDREHFSGLLKLLEKHSLRVEFPNGLRADLLTQPDVTRLARLTDRLKVSLESASSRVQRLIGKNLEIDAVERLARWCREERLALDVHLLAGLPGETKDEVQQTLKKALQLQSAYGARALPQFPVPLPGTRLARHASAATRRRLVADPYPAFQHRPVALDGAPSPRYLAKALETLRLAQSERQSKKVIVNLTYQCNNHCVFCAVGDRPRRHADGEQVCRQLADYRRRGFELLDIDGGEPTLHPELLRVIGRGRELGYNKITLISNGRRLAYRPFARRLLASGLDQLLISLHAAEPTLQAAITGCDEAWAQTTAGIRNALELLPDSEKLAVNTTIYRENLAGLPLLGEYLESLGVRRWNLQLLTPFGRARATQNPGRQAVRRQMKALLDDFRARLEIALVNFPPCLAPGNWRLAAVDTGKGARDMVFIGQQPENLQDFLASRRRHLARCRDCPHLFACGGVYRF